MAPSSSRVKMPIKRGTLGSCAVANTLDMVLQVCYTGVRVGEGCMHYPRSWKEAEVDVPCEGEDLPVLRGGLRKGRVHELSAPEHTDVWL